MLRRSTAHAGLSVLMRASSSTFTSCIDFTEVRVDLLNEVGTVLVALVDAALQDAVLQQGQSVDRG